MMTAVTLAIFGAGVAMALYAIAATVLPQGGHILRALSGRPEPRFAPLTALARAERSIAVRRWASAPAASPIRTREAA